MPGTVPRYPHHALEWSAAGLDLLWIVIAGPASTTIYKSFTGVSASPSVYLALAILISGLFVIWSHYRGIYNVEALLRLDRQIRSAAFKWCGSFAAMIAIAFMMKSASDISRGATIVFFAFGALGLLGIRIAGSVYLQAELARGGLRSRKVALFDLGFPGLSPEKLRQLAFAGFEVAERARVNSSMEQTVRNELERFINAIRGSDTEEILISLPHHMLGSLPLIVDQLRSTPLRARIIPDGQLSYLLFQRRRGFGNFGLVEIKREPLTSFERFAKRGLDLFMAGGAVVALAPLLAIAMLAIKIDSPGPVLFNQTRRGFNGRTFRILKLRTMHVLEDGPNIAQTTRNDSRVTRVGRWFRRTSVDELPQLWNVVRGDMSIVGPRPHAVAHDVYYDDLIENYAYRQHVKPGLTGWAQVNGFRGETPRVEDMKARVDHDLWYISNWSLGLDLRIILLTCTRLLSKGAY